MNLLLDTHVAIWAVDSPNLIRSEARSIIEDWDNKVHVSVASVWEIAIKVALTKNRDRLPFTVAEARAKFVEAGFQLLNVTAEHAIAVESLPPIHADPFDRLILAQAFSEPMRLVSHDRQVARYSDAIIIC